MTETKNCTKKLPVYYGHYKCKLKKGHRVVHFTTVEDSLVWWRERKETKP